MYIADFYHIHQIKDKCTHNIYTSLVCTVLILIIPLNTCFENKVATNSQSLHTFTSIACYMLTICLTNHNDC
jgi:hypothetical protein